jgi:hypothetical protein
MSMDMFLLARGELSDDAARGAIDATCGRLPGVSFAAWDGGAFGGVVSFWRAGIVSIERPDDISEQLPAGLRLGTRNRALVISAKSRAWEFVVFIAQHLANELDANELDAVLFDPQGGEEREFEVPTYDLEDLRVLFDEMQREIADR